MSWIVCACTTAAGICLGVVLATIAYARKAREQARHLEELTDYLEAASLGQKLPSIEDESTLSRLRDEMDKTISALGRMRDDALRTKERYAHNLSNIAHQIKTPVTAIALAAAQIGAAEDARTKAAVERINAQLANLSALQSDLLRLARADAGALAIDKQPTDVYTLLLSTTERVEEQAEARKVSLEVLDSGAVEVLVDEHWMHEALVNIMNDCIACAPPKSSVLLEYKEHPLYVEIDISDKGPGFSDQDIGRLFERFYVGEHASKTSTGLGLAFVREIIERQNGSVRARNMNDGGACFEIRLYRHYAVTSDE